MTFAVAGAKLTSTPWSSSSWPLQRAHGGPKLNKHHLTLSCQLGQLLILSDGTSLSAIQFQPPGGAHQVSDDWKQGGEIVELASMQLREYFAGERQAFDLPLNPGGTEFMRGVWAELERIPFGETISYGELARRIGQPTAARAVGMANGKNPIPIIIPCHRVIGSDGRLTGFAGGIPNKERLLLHESRSQETQTTIPGKALR
jgi:methylated-DNA-[protein]-cysteine S-methyltransferase